MRSSAFACLLAVCVCLGAVTTAGQEAIHHGTISGRVTDQQGAVLPGAIVRAHQTNTNVVRETLTDQSGRFRFPYLRVGPYRIEIQLPGFADAAHTVTVDAGAAFELPVALPVAGPSTTLTVSANATVLDAARSQIAGTVPEDEVRVLPLSGRRFLDVALLVAGVSPTNTGNTQLFPETSAVPGQGLSVASQRNFSNSFLVDGLSANDDAAGLLGIPYSVDAVEQFQVVTSGGQAELGRALGGYISVVTKSGTNQLDGDIYGYFRDDALNAPNALVRASGATEPPMRDVQYGASVGGPLVRNRSFYFFNTEQRRLDQSGFVTIAPDNEAAINARLAAVRYPGSPVDSGTYPNPTDTTHVLAKLDHQLSSRHQLTVRYSLYDVVSANSRGVGGLNAPSASAGLDSRDQSIALSNTSTLSSRTVSETRLQVVRGDLSALPSDPVGPAVSIAGVASFGTLSGSPHRRVNTMYQAVTNLSHHAGSHAVRAGVDIVYNDDAITYPRSVRGSYAFSSLANFLTGRYNEAGFTQTFGPSSVSQRNQNVGVYLQDEWKVRPSITINAGARYDLQFLETVDTDLDNLSPRLGVAWTPGPSRRIVVRGSAGLYFDRIPLRPLANALLSARNTTDVSQLRQTAISVSPSQTAAPVFPDLLAAPVPSVTLPNLTTMSRTIQNAHSRQASVELERQIGRQATVSAGYHYLRGADLIMLINQNVPACAASGTNNGCRPTADYANNNQYSSAGRSNYHGLHVSFVHRPDSWGHFRVSYTLSRSMNNVGENFFSSPIDPADLSKDWGRSDDDQRHRLVISAGGRLPLAVHIAGTLQAYSALPFNILSGQTTMQGTPGRPLVNGLFIPRNAGRGTAFVTLNARVSRRFVSAGHIELEGIAEVFNLTNRANVVARNATFGLGMYPSAPVPTFGQATAVGEPRSMQLGVRLSF